MRSIARSFLAALLALAVTIPVPGRTEEAGAPKARAPVKQPALKPAPAPQTRSAQDDCVREANRRGFTVLDTSNFQQFRDGWSIDLRVRNQRNLLQQHGHEYQRSGAGASAPLAERCKAHRPIPVWPTFTLRSLAITIVSA